MSSARVIANYESLLLLTGQMREAALRADWELLTRIEHRRSDLVAAMAPLDAEVTLDEAARQIKNQLITRVLADDAEIRNQVQAWMAQLQSSMQSNRQEQLLLKTYGV